MLCQQPRNAGVARTLRQFVQRSIAFPQSNHFTRRRIERGEQLAEPPHAAQINRRLREAPLAPRRFQCFRVEPACLPIWVSDFEQILALGAAKLLTGGVAQVAAADAAKTEIRWTHARRRSGERRHGLNFISFPGDIGRFC